jgi:hypothetical protein
MNYAPPEFRPAFSLKIASQLAALEGREIAHKTAGFRTVVLPVEAGGADVLWPQNEPQDTIGHAENGYLAHQFAD